MVASISEKLTLAGNGTRPVPTTVGTLRGVGNTSLICADLTGWPISTACHFITYKIDGNRNVVAGSQTDWKGIVNSSTINSLTVTGGADAGNAVGDIVEILPTAAWGNDTIQAIQAHANQDGTLKQAAVLAALNIGSTPPADWTLIPVSPTTIVNNGQRSQSLTFPGVDYTDRLNPGTRLRTTRTVAAPVQSTLLNGTTQYWSKVAPNKMTFTNPFGFVAQVKLTSYASGGIISRYNGTSGFVFDVTPSGQLEVYGFNGGAANNKRVVSYQSLPLNKWVYVGGYLNMSTGATELFIDGISVPAVLTSSGTAPTSITQAGNFEIGSYNGGTNLFPGKIAQAGLFSAVLTPANVLAYMSQGLTGAEPNLVSAYSFNGVATDLMTTTPNDLTAVASAGYTADSPFGTQASGLISPTLDYMIVSTAVFTGGNTVVTGQTPEGCTIPTSGGVSAVSYSGQGKPYGFPSSTNKWEVMTVNKTLQSQASPVFSTWYNLASQNMSVPVGVWKLKYMANMQQGGTAGSFESSATLSTLAGAESDSEMTTGLQGSSVATLAGNLYREKTVPIATTAIYYLLAKINSGTTSNLYFRGDYNATKIVAENALL